MAICFYTAVSHWLRLHLNAPKAVALLPISSVLCCGSRSRCWKIMEALWWLWGRTKLNGSGRSQRSSNKLCLGARESSPEDCTLYQLFFMTQMHLEVQYVLSLTEKIVLSITGCTVVSPRSSSGAVTAALSKTKASLECWCHAECTH